MIKPSVYEVEVRFRFESKEAAFHALPFIEPVLIHSTRWQTVHYGLELFRQNLVLRIGCNESDEGRRILLGWKGPDTGTVANIRPELEEDISTGISDSHIMKELGGKTVFDSVEAVRAELELLGHLPIATFSGRNLWGYDLERDLHLKLMHCPELIHPWLLEVEKTAASAGEASLMEQDLVEFAADHGLNRLLVREEPPMLLIKYVTNR